MPGAAAGLPAAVWTARCACLVALCCRVASPRYFSCRRQKRRSGNAFSFSSSSIILSQTAHARIRSRHTPWPRITKRPVAAAFVRTAGLCAWFIVVLRRASPRIVRCRWCVTTHRASVDTVLCVQHLLTSLRPSAVARVECRADSGWAVGRKLSFLMAP